MAQNNKGRFPRVRRKKRCKGKDCGRWVGPGALVEWRCLTHGAFCATCIDTHPCRNRKYASYHFQVL